MEEPKRDPRRPWAPNTTAQPEPSPRVVWPVNLRSIKCPACGRVDRWEPVEFVEERFPKVIAFCDCGMGELAFDFSSGPNPPPKK